MQEQRELQSTVPLLQAQLTIREHLLFRLRLHLLVSVDNRSIIEFKSSAFLRELELPAAGAEDPLAKFVL